MSTYYTGPLRDGPMSQATKPYRWTPDGSMCVGSNGVPVFSVACAGQPRPALNCAPGFVQGGIGSRFCTPEYTKDPTLGVPQYGALRNLGPGWVDPDLSNHNWPSLNVPKSDLSIALSQGALTPPAVASIPTPPPPSPAFVEATASPVPALVNVVTSPATSRGIPVSPSQSGSSGIGLDPDARNALVLIGVAATLVILMRK